MSERAKRELDAWIEINIFGRDDVTIEPPQNGDVYRVSWDNTKGCVRNFTTNQNDAMSLLKVCSRRALEMADMITINECTGSFSVSLYRQISKHSESAPTLEIAISLFAKSIFKK